MRSAPRLAPRVTSRMIAFVSALAYRRTPAPETRRRAQPGRMGRSILPSSVRRDAADLGNLGRPTLESPTQPGSFSAPAADTVKFGWLPDVNAVHASKNPVPVTVQRLQRAVGAVCAIWLLSIASAATALGGPYNFTAGPASPVAARSVLGTLPYTGAVAVGGNTIYYLQGTKVFAVSRGTQPSVVTSVPGPLGAWTGAPKTYGYRDLTFAASPTALATAVHDAACRRGCRDDNRVGDSEPFRPELDESPDCLSMPRESADSRLRHHGQHARVRRPGVHVCRRA